MDNIVDLIKKNIKFLVIMLFIILIGIFGITYAIRIGNSALIGIDISTANIDVDITYDYPSDENFISAGKLMPIEDNLVTYSSTDERIIKNKFYVTGKLSNPNNTIYDVALHDVDIDCELRSEDLKWKLFKNGVELSSGNMSPSFDSLEDDRLVLTNIQEDLTTTRVEYVFVMWISESCTGDIKTCNKEDKQNKFLNKNISANIKVELTTKSKKELVRKTGSELSCNYTSASIPTTNTLTYNGLNQTFINGTDGYSVLNNTGKDAGAYNVTAKLNSGYKWEDNSIEDKNLKYTIEKRKINVIANDQTIIYGSTINNSAYTVSNLVSGHSIDSISLNSSISNAGDGTITPSAVKIVDSNNNDVTSNYSINYKKGSLKITCDNSSVEPTVADKIYDGQKQIGVSGGSNIELGGVTAAVQTGDYIANATPSKNYCWSNYSTENKVYNWSIIKNGLRISLNNKTINYNGSEVSVDPAVATLPDNTVVSDVNITYQYYSGTSCDNNLKLTGKPVNAGEYSVKATSDDYNEYDGGVSNCATITINKIDPNLTVYRINDITYETIEYGLYEIVPSNLNIGCISLNTDIVDCHVNRENSRVEVLGKRVGSTYIRVEVLDSVNYNSIYRDYPVNVVCARTATEPTATNKTYNGSIQTGVSGGTNITLGGTVSSKNAGNYTGTATPKTNYCWSNGTTTTKNYNWSIAKAQGSCSITSVPALQYPSNNSGTLSYSCTGDGTISVSSSNTSVVTVNQSTKTNTSVTLNSVGNGSSTINLSQADGTNYFGSSDSATINVNQSNYTVEYYLGNNTSTSGATKIGSKTCSINSNCTLNSWSSLGGTVPFSDKGWSFAGWSTSTNGISRNYTDGQTITATGGSTIKLYAVFKRTITNYSGINKATSQTSTQYYNPYCFDTSNCTSNYSTHAIPTPATITGWTYLGSTSGTSATSSYFTGNGQRSPNLDPIYYAVYSRSISIAYNANGGSGTLSNSTATQKYNSANSIENVSITLKSNTFTKSHYHFVAWGDSSSATTGTNAGSTYTFSNGVSASNSVTLYAVWTANKSIVKFSTNGGDILGETTYTNGNVYRWSRNLSTNNGLISRSNANGTTMSVFYMTYTYADEAKDLTDYNYSSYMNISRTGYKATSNWQWICLSGNCTQTTYNQASNYGSTDFCDNTNGDCEVVLGVNWTGISYTVNFYRGNHSATPGATKLGSVSCTYGSACTLKTWSSLGGSVPVSGVGWSFYGWTTSSSGTSRSYSNGASVSNLTSTDGGTVSLYAVFSRDMIYYSGIDKGSETDVKQYYNPYCYDTTNCTSYYTATTTPDAASVSGWTYKGFSTTTNATSTTYTSFRRNPEGSNEVYAVYERTVTVSYNANGGSGTAPSNSTGTQYYNTDGAVSTPGITTRSNTFTKTGYTFVAWGTGTSSTSGTNAGSSYSFSNGVSASATKTLYAIWKKTITITFDKNTAYSISSTSKSCNMYNSDTSCSITSPTISTSFGSNYWSDSYSSAITAVGFNTSSSATSSSWNAGASKNVSANATYYAITKINTSKTYINSGISGTDPGISLKTSASGSASERAALTDYTTLTITKFTYVSSASAAKDKMWFYVSSYKSTSGYSNSGVCSVSSSNCYGWARAYYINF